MKVTATRRPESVWRILLAALVGLAVIALAAGSDQEPLEAPPQLNDSDAPASQVLVLRAEKSLDIRHRPSVEPPRRPPSSYPDHKVLPRDASPTRKTPQWYDGLWDDPRFMFSVGRVV